MKSKPKIILTYPIQDEMIARELKPHANVLIAKSPSQLQALLKNADGLITLLSNRVDEALLSHAPRLRVVGNFAVGYDNIDLRACKTRGVRVVNTPKVLSRATAELTLALLLAAARRIPEGEELCRSGKFIGWAPKMLLGLELKGRNAVLVGKGRIGLETARLFRALGITVEWITRRDRETTIRAKMKRAQILSFHTSLNPSTRHWLDSKRMKFLPQDAILLNTSRGPVIDEQALIRALKSGKIFAAGLDVYEREPKIPAALRNLDNVVLLPHLGSATRETRAAMAKLVIQGVLGILSGKRPWNEVDLGRRLEVS